MSDIRYESLMLGNLRDYFLVAIKEKIFEDLWEEFDRQPTLEEVDQVFYGEVDSIYEYLSN